MVLDKLDLPLCAALELIVLEVLCVDYQQEQDKESLTEPISAVNMGVCAPDIVPELV